MLKAVKNIGRKIATATLVGSLLLGSGCASYNPKSQKRVLTEYALSQGLGFQTAKAIGEKLGPTLEDNEKEFIEVVSSYPPKLRKACLDSNILDNGHISKVELANTRKATLEGIVNPEEIYAVLANGLDDEMGYVITDLLLFYKLFKDNHVEDENITLLLHNEFHEDYTNTPLQKQFKTNPLFLSKEDKIEIDSEEVTGKKFLQSIKNLKSDYNDKVYIFYVAHGNYSEKDHMGDIEFPWGVIRDFDLNRAISSIEYGRLIVVGSSCYSAGLLKNLNKPKKIKNTLAIASSGVEKLTSSGWPIRFIAKYEKYKKISDILNEDLYPRITTIPFYFDTEKTECSWLDEPFIESQRRM